MYNRKKEKKQKYLVVIFYGNTALEYLEKSSLKAALFSAHERINSRYVSHCEVRKERNYRVWTVVNRSFSQ